MKALLGKLHVVSHIFPTTCFNILNKTSLRNILKNPTNTVAFRERLPWPFSSHLLQVLAFCHQKTPRSAVWPLGVTGVLFNRWKGCILDCPPSQDHQNYYIWIFSKESQPKPSFATVNGVDSPRYIHVGKYAELANLTISIVPSTFPSSNWDCKCC